MPVLDTADALYVGSSAVDAVYLGAGQVWSSAPDELFPGYSPGTPMTLDLVSADANFTLANVQRGTDPLDGQPAALLTTVGSFGTIKTTADHEHVRISVRFRPVARDPFGINNLYMALLGRYVDDSNEWRGQRSWADGNAYLQTMSITAGGQSVGFANTGNNNTDDTTERWLVMDVFEDEIVRIHEWAVGDTPPDLTTNPKRLRGVDGITTTGGDVDNPLTGLAGIRFIYGFYVKELTVTPLARTSTSPWDNLDGSLMKTANEPFFWNRSSVNNDATNGAYVDDVEWSDGITRRTFIVKKDNTTDQSPLWEEAVWLDGAADNVYFTRDHPRGAVPAPSFPPAIRLKIAVQYQDADNSSGGNEITVAYVLYYNGADGALLMNTEGHLDDYHGPLGPNNGQGSCDRTIVEVTVPVNSHEDVVHLRLSCGLHDTTATAAYVYMEFLEAEAVY